MKYKMKNILTFGIILFSTQMLLGQVSRIPFPNNKKSIVETNGELLLPEKIEKLDSILFKTLERSNSEILSNVGKQYSPSMTKDTLISKLEDSYKKTSTEDEKKKIEIMLSILESPSKKKYLHYFKKQLKHNKKIIKQNFLDVSILLVNELNKIESSDTIKLWKKRLNHAELKKDSQLNTSSSKLTEARELHFKIRNQHWVHLAPVRNGIDARLFYQDEINGTSKTKFLNNTLISINNAADNISIFNEIYHDYLGPVRLGFGALVSNSKDVEREDTLGNLVEVDSLSIQQDATQRLLGGGGNAVISFGYPIISIHNINTNFFFRMDFAPKISFDVPALGEFTEKFAFNSDIGIEGSLSYAGILNTLTFFGNGRLGPIIGNAQFKNNLLLDKKSLFLTQLTIGFAINSTFRLAFNWYLGNEFVKENFNSNISFSIIPNK